MVCNRFRNRLQNPKMPTQPMQTRRTTLADVARAAGVSKATASRVLGGSADRVSDELRERVLRAAADLDYVPNPHAQALARAVSPLVALIVHDIADPYFSEIARGVFHAAAESDRLVMICNTFRDPDRELAYLRTLRAQRVQAVLVAGTARSGFGARLGGRRRARPLPGRRRSGGGDGRRPRLPGGRARRPGRRQTGGRAPAGVGSSPDGGDRRAVGCGLGRRAPGWFPRRSRRLGGTRAGGGALRLHPAGRGRCRGRDPRRPPGDHGDLRPQRSHGRRRHPPARRGRPSCARRRLGGGIRRHALAEDLQPPSPRSGSCSPSWGRKRCAWRSTAPPGTRRACSRPLSSPEAPPPPSMAVEVALFPDSPADGGLGSSP